MDLMWIALLVAVASAIIIIIFLSRKAKVLADVEPHNVTISPILNKVKVKVGKYNVFKDLVAVTLLEKLIIKVRIWAQKIENQTLHWLEHLRVNYKKENPNPVFSPEYWDNLKQMAGKKMPRKQSSRSEVKNPNPTQSPKPEIKTEAKKPEEQKPQPSPMPQVRPENKKPEMRKSQQGPVVQPKTEVKKPEAQQINSVQPVKNKIEERVK